MLLAGLGLLPHMPPSPLGRTEVIEMDPIVIEGRVPKPDRSWIAVALGVGVTALAVLWGGKQR